MKRTSVILLCVLLTISSLVPIINSDEPVRSITLYVGGSGGGNYSTIQSAIDAANPGDTVYVYNGTYYEHVIVDKSIDFIQAPT